MGRLPRGAVQASLAGWRLPADSFQAVLADPPNKVSDPMSIDREAISNGHGGQRLPQGRAVEQLLTLHELAHMLQLSEKTIRRMVNARRVPCVRLGRSVRFVPGDVLRWLSARKEG